MLLFYYPEGIAPLGELTKEVGGGRNMIGEASPFCVGLRQFLLAVVQRQGAQVVGNMGLDGYGDVTDGVMVIVAPDAKAVTEEGGEINALVWAESRFQQLELLYAIQSKDLNIHALVLSLLLVCQQVPASLVCFEAVWVQYGIVGLCVGKLLIPDGNLFVVAQRLSDGLQKMYALPYLRWLYLVSQLAILVKEDVLLKAGKEFVGKGIECQLLWVGDAVMFLVGTVYDDAKEIFYHLAMTRHGSASQDTFVRGFGGPRLL